ncbi:MAG TPA: GDSL-type esterase/lipase family protein [Pirellulales bacterium]|nr:GDSL-type esterase/lipase family protein [Pirellulales bacterium]
MLAAINENRSHHPQLQKGADMRWNSRAFMIASFKRARAGNLRHSRRALRVEQLENRMLLSTSLSIAAMGDSLTAPYAGKPYVAPGERNWVEQLQVLRANHVQIYDEAVAGATSSSLLAQGQAATVADLVAHGLVDTAVLIIGGNDVAANLPSIFAGNPEPFVSTVVANIEAALTTVAAAGDVRLVVGNIPDIGITPYFQTFVTNNPFLLQEVTDAVTLANQQIEAFAASRDIPVIDVFGLGHLALNPPILGGVAVNDFYGPDGFHPETAPQGILADAVLEAIHVGYDVNTRGLRLSDQQILTEAGIPHAPGRTFFDVSPYVIFSSPHDDESGDTEGAAVLHAGRRLAQSAEAVDRLFSQAWEDELSDGLASILAA